MKDCEIIEESLFFQFSGQYFIIYSHRPQASTRSVVLPVHVLTTTPCFSGEKIVVFHSNHKQR